MSCPAGENGGGVGVVGGAPMGPAIDKGADVLQDGVVWENREEGGGAGSEIIGVL